MSTFWITVTVLVGLSLTAVVASRLNALRFERRVVREVEAFWPSLASHAPRADRHVDELPEPMRRYLTKAIAPNRRPVASAQIKHGGTFRPKLDGGWLPVRGQQYFRADPPAFVWWGRVRMAPGVWIDARDRYEGGHGNMLVMVESMFTIANSSGSAIDQGSLLRLLAEMVWLPTAFLDQRISWIALDERRAQARLRTDQHDVSGVFELGPDDLPAGFRALRYRDTGDGKAVFTEFYGSMSDYREIDGLLVPHRLIAHWKVGEDFVPYASFDVESIEYDRPLYE